MGSVHSSIIQPLRKKGSLRRKKNESKSRETFSSSPCVPWLTDPEFERRANDAGDILNYILRRPIVSSPAPTSRNILLISANGGTTLPQLLRMFPDAQITYYDMFPVPEDSTRCIPSDDAARVIYAKFNLYHDILPLSSETYDLIVLRQINRILPDHRWVPLLWEARRLCRPGGWIEATGVNDFVCGAGPNNQRLFRVFRKIVEERQINFRFIDTLGTSFASANLPQPTHTKHQCPIGPWGGIVGRMVLSLAKGYLELTASTLESSGQKDQADEIMELLGPWEEEINEMEGYCVVHSWVTRLPESQEEGKKCRESNEKMRLDV